jgi:hypothetical protein
MGMLAEPLLGNDSWRTWILATIMKTRSLRLGGRHAFLGLVIIIGPEFVSAYVGLTHC